ncbi:MAG: DUF1653 domain-containing protein [Firmicutes bacterium]|nr:DUF1653 domain-containing protein [Bacillota bacterium]
MKELEFIGFCGVDCSACPDFLNSKCPGCRQSIGLNDEECMAAQCCMDRGILICGQCKDYPCEDMKDFFEESDGHREARKRIDVIMDILRFKPGDIVQHFKRETLSPEDRARNVYLYEIVGTAVHSETREDLMVYRALYGDRRTYVRPLYMFVGKVDRDKYPDIKQEYRFELVETEGNDE